MALKKSFNNKEIYVRVDRVICGKTVQIPDLLVGIYEQTENNSELVKQSKLHFYFDETHPEFPRFTPEALSVEGNNPLKAAYEYLKTLPQFADYEDV